jgi:hypothetical protein
MDSINETPSLFMNVFSILSHHSTLQSAQALGSTRLSKTGFNLDQIIKEAAP